MTLETSEELIGQNNERSGRTPSRASYTMSMTSATMLRRRRELRYSRDQEALSLSFSRCSTEPSAEILQTKVLERVRMEMECRMAEQQERIRVIRDRLSDQSLTGDQTRESLLHQRLKEEHGLAAAHEEESAIIKQLEQLRFSEPSSSINAPDPSATLSASASRANTNLSLFFQKSATKHPLSPSLRPRSVDYIHKAAFPRRNNFSRPYQIDHGRIHGRSKSLTEDYQDDILHASKNGRIGLSSRPPSPETALSQQRPYLSSSEAVPAVDEFNNSFSLRVIASPRPRSRPRSCIRSLYTPSRRRRNMFSDGARRRQVDDSQYGSVVLLPLARPRSTSDFLDGLTDTSLPSYAQNLMNDFEWDAPLPLALSLGEHRIPETPVQHAPLSPVLEVPSALSSLKGRPSPKLARRKLSRRQRSIFTLRLPLRPSGAISSSRSTLADSSSTSASGSADEHITSLPLVESAGPSRMKGLPSTRNYDLALLDRAPDEISDSPLPQTMVPAAAKNRMMSRPLSVLLGVKSRLVQLGRH